MVKAKSNPFGMSETDIAKLSKLGKDAQSTVRIQTLRTPNHRRFNCSWCKTLVAQTNSAGRSHFWICHKCIPGTGSSATLVDQGGCTPHGNNNHRHGIRTHNGRIGCIGCANLAVTSTSSGEVKLSQVKTVLSEIENKLNKSATKKKKTQLEKAEPYIRSGLGEAFALAIVRGVDDGQVLDLWESTWWRQYPEDDVLIVSVLEGEHSEDDARTINEFRGEHPELALACIHKHVTVNWATMLMDSGFEEHPDAVRDILDGGEPHIVARIRRMKVDKKAMPPGLGAKIKPSQEQKKAVDKDAERRFMVNMKAADWAELYRTHLKNGGTDNTRNRDKILTIYENNWISTRATKKELNDWAKLFGIRGRSKMSNEQLKKNVRTKARDIRSFVRNRMG